MGGLSEDPGAVWRFSDGGLGVPPPVAWSDNPVAWAWIGGAVIGAVIVDVLVAYLALRWARPVTAWLFWISRASKLVGLVALTAFFNAYWYPTYVGQGLEMPEQIRQGESIALAVSSGSSK